MKNISPYERINAIFALGQNNKLEDKLKSVNPSINSFSPKTLNILANYELMLKRKSKKNLSK